LIDCVGPRSLSRSISWKEIECHRSFTWSLRCCLSSCTNYFSIF